jgi:serine/threonine protein kinase
MTASTMSMPAVDSFLKTVLRSGLLSREQLEDVLRQAPGDLRDDPQGLANFLVKTGQLSRFQARKLLQGKSLGLVVGPFQILAPLGKGGMSTVYLARDTRSALLVALKVLPPKKAREEERLLARFLREMEMSQRVAHPHLAQTYDVGVSQGVYYIAMEFIPGRSLYRLVSDEGALPVSRAARLFAEAASALEHAHCRGVIHRDLKPSNIMVTPNDHAKVLDLGLAIIQGEIPKDHTVVGGEGYVVGTMDYIAPEQSTNAAKVDPRSDIYGLGSTLYFALTGQPPFPGGSALRKIKRHRKEEPTPVAELNPMVPAQFTAILNKMMAKRPEDRYESAEALRQDLLPWIGSAPVLPVETISQEMEKSADILAAEPADFELLPEGAVEETSQTPPPRRKASSLTLYKLVQPQTAEQQTLWKTYLLPIAIGGCIGLVIACVFLLLMR